MIAEHASNNGTVFWDGFSVALQRYLADENENTEDNIPYGWTATEEGISGYFVVFLSLLSLVLVLSKFLHTRPKLSSLLPEAGMTILVGIFAGAVVYMAKPTKKNDLQANNENNEEGSEDDEEADVAKALLSFSSTAFFTVLLPPIIFNSGYHLQREIFLRYLEPIALFACLGTFVSTFVVALLLYTAVAADLTGGFQPHFSELLTFGALISATDPVSTLAVFQQKRVDPQLFYLVFGESVLNDAVGLVTFNAFSKFVGKVESFERVLETTLAFIVDFSISFAGSMILGTLSGIAAALLLKRVDIRETPLLELSLYVLVMYLPFFAAEILQMSGIVTILFTGISAKRYAEPNLSMETESAADVFFRVTSHLAETSIFLEFGLSVFGVFSVSDCYYQFILWAMLGCLLGRAFNVYPITLVYNRLVDRQLGLSEQSHHETVVDAEGSIAVELANNTVDKSGLKIKTNTAHCVWFAGLRGAVAYACSKTFPDAYGNQSTFVITTMIIVLATVFLMGGTTEVALELLNVETNVDGEKYLEEQDHLTMSGCQLLKIVDERYISPCVIRNYNRENMPASPSDQQIISELADSSSNQMTAAAETQDTNIDKEMAVLEHQEILRQMGLEYISRANFKRKENVYDYGAK